MVAVHNHYAITTPLSVSEYLSVAEPRKTPAFVCSRDQLERHSHAPHLYSSSEALAESHPVWNSCSKIWISLGAGIQLVTLPSPAQRPLHHSQLSVSPHVPNRFHLGCEQQTGDSLPPLCWWDGVEYAGMHRKQRGREIHLQRKQLLSESVRQYIVFLGLVDGSTVMRDGNPRRVFDRTHSRFHESH